MATDDASEEVDSLGIPDWYIYRVDQLAKALINLNGLHKCNERLIQEYI